MIASSRRMVEELGITQQLLEADVFTGLIDLLEGDAVAAERSLRTAYDGLRAHGLGIDAARAAAFLGRALLAQGRAAEAEALSHESEALAGDDLQATITWRGVRAEALARHGEQAAAIDFARAAVDIAGATDVLLLHADARQVLATTLRTDDRGDEADVEERRAIELWEAKGATLLAERPLHRQGALPPGSLPLEKGGHKGFESSEEISLSPRSSKGEGAPRRRVRPNAATANTARYAAAIAARDVDAIAAQIADDSEVMDHTTGATYDRQAMLATWRAFLRAQGGTYRYEPLATLGNSLALGRTLIAASGAASETFDVGAYEVESVLLIEVDAQGRRRRSEMFAADRLGDAVARLYERYAQLLPDGPERVRAMAMARWAPALAGPWGDLDRLAIAPAIEVVDHRTLGTFSAHGQEAARQGIRSWLDLAVVVAMSLDDVLSLHSGALLGRVTFLGTDRDGGGTFERRMLQIVVYGTDGLMTRWEMFDADRDAEALARFDEIVGSNLDRREGEPSGEPWAARSGSAGASPSQTGLPSRAAQKRGRRVRPNAATANAARLQTALAARDFDALLPLFAEDMEAVHHPTGATYDRQRALAETRRSLPRYENVTFTHEPLATLGDSLALCSLSVSASGVADGDFSPTAPSAPAPW
ncbi:MAG: DUF4440 domain-containing protein [Deltaproteobacteria bacterium]|nr:DUF4440 domain-containing protein [Deltaproteobacteria bacterium]MBI3389075.1 DUF4440 domain-containing protein [Deltaproteobacteria bacterium]